MTSSYKFSKVALDIVAFHSKCTRALTFQNVCQIFWEKGNPVKVVNLTTKEEAKSPANILKMLNRLGGAHAIGRIDIVENRYVGIKSRGVYETPGMS